jgi:hypothetical protein
MAPSDNRLLACRREGEQPMSKHQQGSWRDDFAFRRRICSTDRPQQKSCSTDSEPMMDWCTPDICTEIRRPRSRSSILAPHVGNCSRAVLLGVGEVRMPAFEEARRSVREELEACHDT